MTLLLMLACTATHPDSGTTAETATHTDGGTGADGGTTGPTGVPDLPTAGCDSAPYTLLPLEQMGQLVALEAAEDLAYDAETLNSILDVGGLGALTPVPYGVRTWRVRYTTQDHGQAIEATGYIVLPDAPGQTVPVMLWNHPTTGFNDSCAPTNQGVIGAAFALLMGAHGFAVAAPDYLGMAGFGEPSGRLHPWMVGEPTAFVALDSVRALLATVDQLGTAGEVELSVDPHRTVIFGPSEGGFATLWADRYQAAYLPEITIAGSMAAIPGTDPLALTTIATTTTSETTAATAAILTSMADWYSTDAPLSDVLLSPFDEQVPQAMSEQCTDWGDVFGDASAPDDIFTTGLLDAAAEGGDWSEDFLPWSCFLGESVLRNSPVDRGHDAPVLVVTGELDQLAWPQPTHDDVLALCEQGYRIEHVQCAGQDHTGAAVTALPMMMTWAAAAGRGEDPMGDAETCVVAEPSDCTAP